MSNNKILNSSNNNHVKISSTFNNSSNNNATVMKRLEINEYDIPLLISASTQQASRKRTVSDQLLIIVLVSLLL